MARFPRYLPEHWPTMKAALMTWLGSVVPPGRTTALPAIYREPDAPSPPRPYVAIGLLTPPVAEGQAYHVHRFAVRVPEATALATYTITVDDTEYTYVAGAEPTVTSIRDALLDLVLDDLGEGSVFAVGTDALAFDFNADGEVVTTAELTDNLVPKLADMALSDGVSTFQVDVFGGREDPGGHDVVVMGSLALERALDQPAVREALNVAGWAPLSTPATRRAPVVSGALWENRAGFDVRMRSRLRSGIELVDFIETFDATSVSGSYTR